MFGQQNSPGLPIPQKPTAVPAKLGQILQPSKQDLICPPFSVGEYVRDRHNNRPILLDSIVSGANNASPFLKDILCAMSVVGALEPLTATRPAAADIVTVFDKTVDVPHATLGEDGVTVVPTERVLIRICAGQQSLVIERLRALAANLTAATSGSLKYKRVAVSGFSEGFCPPGEPGVGEDEGTFQNIEHLVLCPEAGFDVYGVNSDLFSNALFSIHARMWSTC